MLRPEQISDIAQALGGLPEDSPVWCGLLTLLRDQIQEADDFATHHDTPEEKRPGWCGRKRGLADLEADLQALRTGGYRTWPEMRAHPAQSESESEPD